MDDMLNYYRDLIGRKIRIIELDGEPNSKYVDKVGEIRYVNTDPWGDVYLSGTWGGVNIYPTVDSFEIL